MDMKDIPLDENAIKYVETEICEDFCICYTMYAKKDDSSMSYSVKAAVKNSCECATASNLTPDKNKAIRIFNMLCTGGVTPCCLTEVAEDIIESLLWE